MVAVLPMLLLHVLGSLRRLSSNGLLHTIVLGAYTLSFPLVSYTIGRMQSSDCYHVHFAVWAVFLLLLLGNTDSLTVCRLSDIDNWKSIYVKHLLKGFMMVYVVLKIYGGGRKIPYWAPLSAILVIVVLKWYVMIASMRTVSKSYLRKNTKVVAEYMKHEDNNLQTFDPVTMEGYRYMVAGEKYYVKRPAAVATKPWYEKDGSCLNKVITVEKIWQCQGNLLRRERGKLLKDLCLSMALSKMLNRRFAGFELSEAELEKTHDFVFKGLLAGDKPHQRAFRVVEEELVFVHDLYYTRYSYLDRKGRFFALCLPIIMFSLCSWLTYLLAMDPLGRVPLTIFITVVMAFLEAYQLYLYIASGWFKVALVRSYVTMPFRQRSGCFLEVIIGLLLRFKAYRPWKGKLGQYCILGDLGRRSRVRSCLHYATLYMVDKTKKGRKNSVKLSENVKKAVVDSLLRSNGQLTNGVASLHNNGVHGKLPAWACHVTATDGKVTRTILVWHIATTLCEHHLVDAQDKEVEDAVKTASTLSRYCLHLLAFAPNLLPGHSSESESMLDRTLDEANELLKKVETSFCFCERKKVEKKLKSRCEELLRHSTHDGDGDGDADIDGDREKSIVMQGARLARCLLEDIPEMKLRWKVLSDFWAEMMLYVSPSDDARAHLEGLAKGGEFITHIWVLLTHAGVLKRGLAGPKDVV